MNIPWQRPKTPIGQLLGLGRTYKGTNLGETSVDWTRFHSTLNWLLDSGFDIGKTFEAEQSYLGFSWKDVIRTSMVRTPSKLFSLNSFEFIEG
jgi:hypothetical protein